MHSSLLLFDDVIALNFDLVSGWISLKQNSSHHFLINFVGLLAWICRINILSTAPHHLQEFLPKKLHLLVFDNGFIRFVISLLSETSVAIHFDWREFVRIVCLPSKVYWLHTWLPGLVFYLSLWFIDLRWGRNTHRPASHFVVFIARIRLHVRRNFLPIFAVVVDNLINLTELDSALVCRSLSFDATTLIFLSLQSWWGQRFSVYVITINDWWIISLLIDHLHMRLVAFGWQLLLNNVFATRFTQSGHTLRFLDATWAFIKSIIFIVFHDIGNVLVKKIVG